MDSNNGIFSYNGTSKSLPRHELPEGISMIPTITITDPSGVSHQESDTTQNDRLLNPPLVEPPDAFAHIRELANSSEFRSIFSNNGDNAGRGYMIDFESYVLAVSNWRRGGGQFLHGERCPDLADHVKFSRGCGCASSQPNVPSLDFARYIQAVVNRRDRHVSYEERPNLADYVMTKPFQPPTSLPRTFYPRHHPDSIPPDFPEPFTPHRLWQWCPPASAPVSTTSPVSSIPSHSSSPLGVPLGIPPPARNDDVITPNPMRMSVLSNNANSLLSTSTPIKKY